MESVAEVWKDVVGEEGNYRVSSLGRIESVERFVPTCWGALRLQRGKILKPTKTTHGYLSVCLTGSRRFGIHRLVAAAFIGPPPESRRDINHKDGCKTNNRVENLEYCTKEENVHHAYRTGLINNGGERNPHCTSTKEQVVRAYELVKSGVMQKDAAAMCGISDDVVYSAIRGRKWKLPPLPKRKTRRWTDVQINECIALREQGMSFTQIQRKTGIPDHTVRYHWSKALAK